MLVEPDCYPCILRMAVGAIKKLSLGPDDRKALYTRIAADTELQGRRWDVPSPVLIERVMREISSFTGSADPFQEAKDRMNQAALRLYPRLKNIVAGSDSPIRTAVRLAVMGNAVDFMVPEHRIDLETSLTAVLDMDLPAEPYDRLEKKLAASKSILVFGDNCGEIVLDRLMLETLAGHFDVEFHYVVRSHPAMNDATLREARAVGLDRTAELVENGIDGPVPGTILDRCGQGVLDLVRAADLVISKGGGNFDTLNDEQQRLGDVTFMLLCKCDPYGAFFNTERNQPILANYFS